MIGLRPIRLLAAVVPAERELRASLEGSDDDTADAGGLLQLVIGQCHDPGRVRG